MAAASPWDSQVTLLPPNTPLYTHLNLEQEEIRLLAILPESYSHDIRCHLATHSLKDLNPAYRAFLTENNLHCLRDPDVLEKWTQKHISPKLASLDPLKRVYATQPPSQLHRFAWGDFAALSYVWGDSKQTRSITVNERVMAVTINLERALREFRNTGDFRHGFRLWVDALCINQEDLTERASLVKKMPSIYGSAWCVVAWLGKGSSGITLALQLVRDLITFREASYADELELRLREDPRFLGTMKWLGLHELMDRLYWYRLWIIQEIAMGGSRTTLRCGAATLYWVSFCSGIAMLQEHLWLVKDKCLEKDVEDATSTEYSGWKTTSLHLVYRHLTPLSGDRDKVYALAGLMPASVTRLLQPEYTLPVTERRIETPISGPSYLFPRESDNRELLPYRASGDLKGKPVFLENEHLECTGFIVSKISGLSARWTGFFAWSPYTVASPKDFDSAYGDFDVTAEAIFRTLVADRDIYRQKATRRHTAILQLPSTFEDAEEDFLGRGWSWLAGLEKYYYRWERFRQANKDFRLGPFEFDEFFSEKMPPGASEYDITEAYSCFDRSSQKRQFMTTSSGHVDWAPDNIYGAPYVQTEVLGEAYVQGLMDGEAIEGLKNTRYETGTFTFC
ncbi:HET-domain-containing protein [Lentithecium fluviatile CBS 122367]|uniref:HET-domain-containing protein n=1 Tax=Lentithecium fluviatile CBS 122367 TaxID=1168545 RepID=A0A6G1IVF0_9PLEO|nr:HET-domain-containing protein [Lentithecium fluviatile CBS 122367]